MGKVFSVLLVFSLCLYFDVSAQRPAILSVDKGNGPIKDVVTLKGSDFGTDPTKLKVFFGGAPASIKQVSNQLLEVITPAGTTYDNISVTNLTNGLTGYASDQ
jgi:hypothetical protein